MDIVWRELQEKVKEEVRSMVNQGGEGGEATADDYFQLWNTAARNVYESLMHDKQATILEKVKKAETESNPLDIQRRCVTVNNG